MAQTHNREHNGSDGAAITLHDDDLVLAISAKDASEGFFTVVPMAPLLALLGDNASPATVTAFIHGVEQDLQRKLQAVATANKDKPWRDQKIACDAAVAAYVPDISSSRNVSARRVTVAAEHASAALAAKGKQVDPSKIKADPELPKYMERHAEAINVALMAKITGSYPVSKKGKGSAGGMLGDLD